MPRPYRRPAARPDGHRPPIAARRSRGGPPSYTRAAVHGGPPDRPVAPDPDPSSPPAPSGHRTGPGDPRPGADPDDPDVIAAQLEADLVDVVDAPPKPKRWWVLPLRIAISAAMLWYLVRRLADVSLADLVPEWSTETGLWLGVALALTAAGVVLSAARWRQVLEGMRVPSRFG